MSIQSQYTIFLNRSKKQSRSNQTIVNTSFESLTLVFFMKVNIVITQPQDAHHFKQFEEGCKIHSFCVVDDRFPASLFLKYLGNT